MVAKSLNNSIDSYLDKVKGDKHSKKQIKSTISTNYYKKFKKKFKNMFVKIKKYIKGIKDYFFPGIEFEEKPIDNSGTTVVQAVDKGIKQHIKLIIEFFKIKKHKKLQEKKEIAEKDVNQELVLKTIEKNKIK